MTRFDDRLLTKRVVESFSQTPNERQRSLLVELVTTLHDFVRRTDLTFEEWNAAIGFLTRTGQKCTPTRQEFILLSDVLGVSMLVDAVNHREREGATETTVLGPFYVGEHKDVPDGSDISAGLNGKPMFVTARVTAPNGVPVANAIVDVWHADDAGFYDTQRPSHDTGDGSLRARFRTDASGRFSFRTILPCSYPIPTDGPVGELIRASNRHAMRPAHVHFLVNAAGFEPLVTHVFMDGDDYLDSDVVFGVKEELVCRAERHDGAVMPDGSKASGAWYTMTYDFHVRPGTGHLPQPLTAGTG
ncbi:hydroxyquinol 1,2-dioxygenase [Bradyrhizobium sp. Arg68]|uniref:dioxygenase family protein n=1 Tax=Bradyrhizobium ivorense TaxID=2511166 RepID=UPI001E4DA683|nr:dioxygenase [Bradyrhizobium ivorense]MCC8939287.1 hydroxyquinol 1,2-dioxygenase [Bradyrhizobium ivorense]